jgi:hypothetical protein
MPPHSLAAGVLCAAYASVGAYLGVRLYTLVSQGHRLLHYSVIFHSLALTWMLLRLLWWSLSLASVPRPTSASDLLFWLPHSVIWLTFATLALFFFRLVHWKVWSGDLRARYLLAFAALALVDVVATITLAVLDDKYSREEGPAADRAVLAVQIAESAMNAGLFFLLAAGFA